MACFPEVENFSWKTADVGGSALATRFVRFFPERVKSWITVCVPVFPLARAGVPLADFDAIVRNFMPNFGYQIYFMNPESTEEVNEHLKAFILLFGFQLEWGLEESVKEKIKALQLESLFPEGNFQKHFKNVSKIVESIEIGDPELSYLIAELKKGGMEGPLNWYRTRSLDYADEQAADLPVEFPCDIPCLFLGASKDPTLPPAMFTREMKAMQFPKGNLTCTILDDANHFLFHAPPHRDEVTKIIGDWIDEQGSKFGINRNFRYVPT
ncbi:hypothetical protein O181_001302 [Austropuccinia psidii MF-1]|uniref:Uncharacterized protein n=1 Tax=Austropuccinia psidii MF-1 TaxID=1389203 RepID=A0A9Q3BAB8_9BASI|nr:hypothetical protein [Austropuccinia psidii MF-1]